MRKGLLLSRKGARDIGSGLIHGYTYYYKYEICLADIFNFLGEIFAIFFSEFIDFVFTPLCEKDFGFQEKNLGWLLRKIWTNDYGSRTRITIKVSVSNLMFR